MGGKTFVMRPGGRWEDTAWDAKSPPTRVEAWSEAYFALLARGDDFARILALGSRLLFVWEGIPYEIVPARPPPAAR